MQHDFALVVAADEALGIGRAGGLPWRLPGEMAYFKRLTTGARDGLQNAVIMGRKTFDSIAPKFRPLAGRLNVVLSRDPAYRAEGALTADSLEAALALLDARDDVDRVFVIGGGELYRRALPSPRCRAVYLTRIHARFACDTFLPALDAAFSLSERDGPHREGDLTYTFELHTRA